MAKTIKFNLICDNTPVRTIEDLQNNSPLRMCWTITAMVCSAAG